MIRVGEKTTRQKRTLGKITLATEVQRKTDNPSPRVENPKFRNDKAEQKELRVLTEDRCSDPRSLETSDPITTKRGFSGYARGRWRGWRSEWRQVLRGARDRPKSSNKHPQHEVVQKRVINIARRAWSIMV